MSDQPRPSFGEQLIRTQSFSPSAAERYRNEMQAFLERRLATPHRWLGLGMAFIFLAFAVAPLFMRHKWATMPPQLQPWLLFIIPLSFLMLAAWSLWVAVRGRYNRKVFSHFALLLALLMLGFGGVEMVEQGWAFEDPIARRRLIFAGVTMLLLLAGTILAVFLEEMHRRTEERLIRLECRLAELSEKIDRPQQGPDK